MNYSAMIQNRKSVHAFREKEVPSEAIGQLRSYYEKTCPRLVPEIATELIVLDKDAQPALESSAGYRLFEVDGVQNPDLVAVFQKCVPALDHDTTFRVSDHIGTVTL